MGNRTFRRHELHFWPEGGEEEDAREGEFCNGRTDAVCDPARRWQTMASLCREFGISRKTGYKIFERHEQCGLARTLSDDGKTLTKNIHRSGPRGDSDQQYVLEKQSKSMGHC